MPRLNVAKVLSNSQFKDSFTVYRKTGNWIAGRFKETEDPIIFSGVVTAPGTKDLIQVPEGDRTSEIMCFHSTNELFVTHNDVSSKGTSDEIEWNNKRYRIYQVKNWNKFGFYKAIGISMEGD